jgi:hypothetical protein
MPIPASPFTPQGFGFEVVYQCQGFLHVYYGEKLSIVVWQC